VVYESIVTIGAALLGAVILARTLLFTSKQVQVEPVTDIAVSKKAAQRLSEAIQFKTVSYQNPQQFEKEEFLGLHTYLEKAFPRVHAVLTREVVGEYSLLYCWKGRSEQVKPLLLMAHIDVVPVEPGTEPGWTYPPFKGCIADGYIWGRGSMDLKGSVLAILEAVETLLKNGFCPERTVYLAFGHDEEVGGHHGASQIVALLKSRGISLEYVLDEGGSITEGVVPGVSTPVALVGIAEKGYLSLELTVEAAGGHSSMPPRDSALNIVAKAVYNLEENQMPAKIEGTTKQMFEYVGPEMSFVKKMVFANTWLFGWLVKRQLARSPETDALIRTTTAPTIAEGGTKENVLPKKVRFVVNFRILPGDTVEQVINHAQKTINDPRVKITPLEKAWEQSIVSNIKSKSFETLQKTIRQIFPGTAVAPYLVVGATDSRYYTELTSNVFKLVPILVTPEDLNRVHGVDERISLEDHEQAVKFYVQLIRNSQ